VTGLLVEVKILLHLSDGKLCDYGYGNTLKPPDSFFYVFPYSGVSNVVRELMSFPRKHRYRRRWRIQGGDTFYEICLKQEINVLGDLPLRVAVKIRRIKDLKTGTIKLWIGGHLEQYVTD